MKFYGIDVQGYVKLRDFTDEPPVYDSSDERKLIYVNNTVDLTDEIYIGGIQCGDWVRVITENDPTFYTAAECDSIFLRNDESGTLTGSLNVTGDLQKGGVDVLTGSDRISFGNKIINGNFVINQRDVSGTVVLAIDEYGHDRWKAGSGGCTYTFVTSNEITTLTITVGTLMQVIEGINLQSGSHILSWTGTSQGRINTGSYGISGSVTDDLTGGTNTNIEFGTGTLSLVQFEKGTTNTNFEYKLIADEEILCRRYYQTGEVYYYGIAGYLNKFGASADLSPHMRITPTVVWTNIDNHAGFSPTPAASEIISNKKVIELRASVEATAYYSRYFHTAFGADAEL